MPTAPTVIGSALGAIERAALTGRFFTFSRASTCARDLALVRLTRDPVLQFIGALRDARVLIVAPSIAAFRDSAVTLVGEDELGSIPFLAGMRALVPSDHRLVVAVWDDHSSVVTAVPRDVPEPPLSWLNRVHVLARNALSENLTKRGKRHAADV